MQQGVTQAQGAQSMAQMAAQLNQANFGQAQAAATGDINRDLSAQQGNQGGQNAINSLIQAATGLGGLGNQAQQNQRQQFIELCTAGAQQQQQAQAADRRGEGQVQPGEGLPSQQLGVLQARSA